MPQGLSGGDHPSVGLRRGVDAAVLLFERPAVALAPQLEARRAQPLEILGRAGPRLAGWRRASTRGGSQLFRNAHCESILNTVRISPFTSTAWTEPGSRWLYVTPLAHDTACSTRAAPRKRLLVSIVLFVQRFPHLLAIEGLG